MTTTDYRESVRSARRRRLFAVYQRLAAAVTVRSARVSLAFAACPRARRSYSRGRSVLPATANFAVSGSAAMMLSARGGRAVAAAALRGATAGAVLLGDCGCGGAVAARGWAAGASDGDGGGAAAAGAAAAGRVSGRTVSPITRALWEKRQRMDAALAAEAAGGRAAREQTDFSPKRPDPLSVTFPFSEDPVLVEQYRSPWCARPPQHHT